jgi:hypothetical protein
MSKYRPTADPARACITSASELVWRKSGHRFTLHFHNRGPVLLAVVPDDACPSMWRVRRPDSRLSDMVNLARAKDAAVSIALGILNRKKQNQETPLEAPPARQKRPPYVSVPGDLPARGAAP